MSKTSLPALTADGGLGRYLTEIKRFPLLSKEEETRLARRWSRDGDVAAAHLLVTSHLRLAARIAFGYRGYGLPMAEIVSEGNVGLMRAVKRFDPERGFRLATYAMWWIRASIQEYILRSWSLVKTGTTTNQKKLFFNLRRLKNRLGIVDENELRPAQIEKISETLKVGRDDVADMNKRMSGKDRSLNALISIEGQEEWQDLISDDRPDQETALEESQEADYRGGLLLKAMDALDERERAVLTARRLNEAPPTLETLSHEYGVSRERIRQIEAQALKKVARRVHAIAHNAEGAAEGAAKGF